MMQPDTPDPDSLQHEATNELPLVHSDDEDYGFETTVSRSHSENALDDKEKVKFCGENCGEDDEHCLPIIEEERTSPVEWVPCEDGGSGRKDSCSANIAADELYSESLSLCTRARKVLKVSQKMFQCLTCELAESIPICERCFKSCHKGHRGKSLGICFDRCACHTNSQIEGECQLSRRFDVIRQELESLIALNPTNSHLRFRLGSFFFGCCDFARAVSTLEQVTTMDPENQNVNSLVGRAHVHMLRPEKAMPYLESVFNRFEQQINRDKPPLCSTFSGTWAVHALGNIHLCNGEWSKAFSCFELIVKSHESGKSKLGEGSSATFLQRRLLRDSCRAAALTAFLCGCGEDARGYNDKALKMCQDLSEKDEVLASRIRSYTGIVDVFQRLEDYEHARAAAELAAQISKSGPVQRLYNNTCLSLETERLHRSAQCSVEKHFTPQYEALAPGSPAFDLVSRLFYSTALPFDDTVRAGFIIHEIQFIHIEAMWERYKLLKRQMDRKNAKFGARELFLFHGTSSRNAGAIAASGFNRSYCGKNATVYGKGVYFARNASYSAYNTFSPADENGQRRMFLASVLAGESTKGSSDMLAPPPYPNGSGMKFDSTTDKATNPAVHVVFHDEQAYPQFLITFSGEMEYEERHPNRPLPLGQTSGKGPTKKKNATKTPVTAPKASPAVRRGSPIAKSTEKTEKKAGLPFKLFSKWFTGKG